MSENNTDNTGHRTRIREKYYRIGPKAFEDYELLELLLSYALPRRDVKPLAKQLLQKYDSLSRLIDTSVEDLANFKGLGKNSAILLKLNKDIAVRYLEQDIQSEDIMNNPGKIANFARFRLGGMDVEAMMVLFLNTQNMLIEHEIICEGTTDQVNIYPSEIARKALIYHAKSIILCHNHPGGKVRPSEDDIHVTRNLRDILRTVNIFLLDHIIVSRFNVFSLRREQSNMPTRAQILEPLPESNVCAEPPGEYFV